MLRTGINTKLKRIAATGTLCLVACGPATAGWLCNWSGSNNRPYYDPSHEPNWGVEETTWRRFAPQSDFNQGSYCATGECQPGMSITNTNGVVMPAPSMQGMLIQQAPVQQPQMFHQQPIIQQPQMMHSSEPSQMLHIPNQQDSIFAPPEMVPYDTQAGSVPQDQSYPMNGMSSESQGHAVPLMAPQPQPQQQQLQPNMQMGAPVPMMNNSPIPNPSSTLNPLPGNGSGNGNNSVNPVPFPMSDEDLPRPMPPMTQSNYYQSPFNQAAPGNYITNPTANYGYQQQAANPAEPISYQSSPNPSQQSQPSQSRNPFSTISRLWSRGK